MTKPKVLKISWTRYDAYTTCALKYWLRYIQKVKVPALRRPFVKGSIVHEVIKEWAEAGYPTDFMRAAVVRHYKSQVAGMRFKSKQEALDIFKKALRGALSAEQVYTLLKFKEHGAFIEPRYDVPFPLRPDVAIIGGSDVFDPEYKCIFDLKLYEKAGQEVDVRQILTYTLAERFQGHEVTRGGGIYPLLSNRVRTIELPEASIDKHHNDLLRMVDEEKNLRPTPTPSWLCRFCEYNRTQHCPATYGMASVPVQEGAKYNLVSMRGLANA